MTANFLLALSLAVVVSTDDDFLRTECTDPNTWLAENVSFVINECAPETTCQLVKGTDKWISISFTPKADIHHLKPLVHGIISNIPVPYDITKKDACVDSGLQCPLKQGEQVTYNASMPILKIYPKIRLPILWELVRDKTDEVVACKVIDAQIVKTLMKKTHN